VVSEVLAIGFDGGRLKPMFGVGNPFPAGLSNGRLGARMDASPNVNADLLGVGVGVLLPLEGLEAAGTALVTVVNDPRLLLLA
jgi:hypothetical protein